MKQIILVTQPEFEKAQTVFNSAEELDCRAAPTNEQELAECLKQTGSRIAVLGTHPYNDQLYTALERNSQGSGALIIRFGFGMDNINRALCEQNNITLANTPVDIQTSVAELTLFLLGGLLRNISLFNTAIRNNEFTSQRGRELSGKTALILGGGKIGLQVAAMLHRGFNVSILLCDSSSEEQWHARNGISQVDLREIYGVKKYSQNIDELLPQADILSIHLPLMDSTRKMIDKRRIALLKHGAFLINTARGGIVDEAALFDALATGQLAGAAMDVFAAEPYTPAQPDKDLRILSNMIMTPHCASDTVEANNRMATRAVELATAFVT